MFQSQAPAGAFDVVGAYCQDEVNGFSSHLLDRLIAIIEPEKVASVLDAMAGDGNLSERLLRYCIAGNIPKPAVAALEYSRVQAEFARMRLSELGASVLWADVLSMTMRESGEPIPAKAFERVVIKSANHEIPRDKQPELYSQLFNVLEDGGSFINLGMLFEDSEERDEFRSIAKVKDSLAKMFDAVRNRHFLTREELYGWLNAAGFVDIRTEERFEYRIRSGVVARQYFGQRQSADIEHQVAQVRAVKMRRNGRILFEKDESIMLCPGEITVARKPTPAERNGTTYTAYPYDFLRKVEAHKTLMTEVASLIPEQASVLDLGCGLGLLFEHVSTKVRSYVGFDISEEFVHCCKRRYGQLDNAMFEVVDLNEISFCTGKFDVVTLVNVLYHEGLKAVQVLKAAQGLLRDGGLVIVSGPLSRHSFINAEPMIRAQLTRDGHLPAGQSTFDEIVAANARLLGAQGNYWSAEGMAELLQHLGYSSIERVNTDHFYGQSYLVAGRR